MRLQRLFAIVPAAIAIVAMAAVVILWLAARTPWARSKLEASIGESIGLPVSIERIRLGVVPIPALAIEGLAIAQPPGFGSEPFVTVGRLRVTLPWRSLVGSSALQTLTITGPTLRLVITDDGTSNWSRYFARPAGPPAATAEPAQDWSVDRLALEQGAVEYEDRSTDSRWRLTAITATGSAIAPGRPFSAELRGAGVAGEHTFHYALAGEARIDPAVGRYAAGALEFSGWAGGDPLPLAGVELDGTLGRAAFESATGVAVLEAGRFELATVPGTFSGRLDFDEDALEMNLVLATDAFNLRRPAVAFGKALPQTSDPESYGAVELTLHARTRAGVLHLDPVTGRLDATRFKGRVVPSLRLIRAELDTIDMNRYLPAASAGNTARPSTRQARATLEEQLAELEKLDLDAEIRIGEARIGGARVRDAVIRVERAEEPAP